MKKNKMMRLAAVLLVCVLLSTSVIGGTFAKYSDYVTIPVRININRELAVAGATKSGITVGKEYLDAGSGDSISVSKNSAFTVQFVTSGLNDTNYGARVLRFSAPLPSGTTIVLLDYTGYSPRYAHCTMDGSTSKLNLASSFILMGKNTQYTVNTGADITEKLLFVVDFSGAVSGLENGDYTAQMIVKSNDEDVKDAVSKELKFTTTGIRTFSASVDKVSLNYGESFNVNYSVGNASNDSKYKGRALSLIVSGSGLPSDAYLIANGIVYRQNEDKQFIIPLTGAQDAGSNSIALKLMSDTLVNNLQPCTLTAKVMISATANAGKPLKGSTVNTMTVTYDAVKPPSLRVDSMSDRALSPDDLGNAVELFYTIDNIPGEATVTLEVQRYVGAGYSTDTIYLERVTPSTSVSQGVYTVDYATGKLSLLFSQRLEIGNYQILMSVKNSTGDTLVSVPYRFVVTE